MASRRNRDFLGLLIGICRETSQVFVLDVPDYGVGLPQLLVGITAPQVKLTRYL
jgi:hypothetical protein